MSSQTTSHRERVAAAIRDACKDEFGSTWCWDVALRFADAAIKAHRDNFQVIQGEKMQTDSQTTFTARNMHPETVRYIAKWIRQLYIPASSIGDNLHIADCLESMIHQETTDEAIVRLRKEIKCRTDL